MPIVHGQLLRHTQRHSARNDRDFVQRIGAFGHRGNQRVSGFVIRRDALFMFVDEHRLARDAHQHLVFGDFEIFVRDTSSGSCAPHSTPLR